jgi:cytochrome c peroxidase
MCPDHSLFRVLLALLMFGLAGASGHVLAGKQWTDAELALLKMQWIGSLPELPPDPSNRYADNTAAVSFGHQLFFDTRFSANGKVSCAICHIPQNAFTDGRATARGIGDTSRSTPTIIGVAHSPWFFWDGRSDSQWSQALGPMENAVEHGGNRLQYARILFNDAHYRTAYENIFGSLPDLNDKQRFPANASPVGDNKSLRLWQSMTAADRDAVNRVYANMGKAIAAYERRLMPGPSRFDRYVEALLDGRTKAAEKHLGKQEIAGLKLFIGKARCVTCHQGPLFSNHGFHNVGTPDPATRKPDYLPAIIYLFMDKPEPDQGRYPGVQQALSSEFNCLGKYSDAEESECAELKYANTDHRATLGAFKVPTLRNVSRTAPYTHAGIFPTLKDVVQHYNAPPEAPVGHSELRPLNLGKKELTQIVDFLGSLDSPVDADPKLLRPPE